MHLRIPTIRDGQPIPDEHCFLVSADEDHVRPGPNRSPQLTWEAVPEATQSFCILLVDPDAPAVADEVNVEGKTLARSLPRADFHHWILVDVPADRRELPAGAESDGVVQGGKSEAPQEYGLRGRNNFTEWFEGDADMQGVYAGYDGPAPPWNDERMHHYHFKLFALDVPTLGLSAPFTADEALEAMEGHVLAEAECVGTCSLNPNL